MCRKPVISGLKGCVWKTASPFRLVCLLKSRTTRCYYCQIKLEQLFRVYDSWNTTLTFSLKVQPFELRIRKCTTSGVSWLTPADAVFHLMAGTEWNAEPGPPVAYAGTSRGIDILVTDTKLKSTPGHGAQLPCGANMVFGLSFAI